MDIYKIINRSQSIFEKAILHFESEILTVIQSSKFLVVGGAGTIGQAVVKEIYSRKPKLIDIVDVSENNLVELIRDIRSTFSSSSSELRTFALDVASKEFDSFLKHEKINYDYILNLSALKHVRSEKDPYTLMRLIEVNIFNALKLARHAQLIEVKKYFSVSTDKAANPVNLMGASKRLMERFLWTHHNNLNISMARFANVAFSDGSLLHGFAQRFAKLQPIAVPGDVLRYFITQKESGQLCLLSAIFGKNGDIFFPSRDCDLELTSFVDVASRFLEEKGYKPEYCKTENEARAKKDQLINKGYWPVFVSTSDTTGEKSFEEFFTNDEHVIYSEISGVGIIRGDNQDHKMQDLNQFEAAYRKILDSSNLWKKEDIVKLFTDTLPDLCYEDLGKNLDQKM